MTVENTGLESFIAKPVVLGTTKTAIKSVRKAPTGAYTLECSDGTMSSVTTIANLNHLQIDRNAITASTEEESEA